MSPDSARRKSKRNHIEVAREGQSVLLKIVGLGDMHLSHVLGDFIESSLSSDYLHFAIDLENCAGMDSTFMGTLVGINARVRTHGGWMCIVNLSEENQKLLDMLGVSNMVQIKDSFPIQSVATECLKSSENTARRIAQIKHAHEQLIGIDEENRKRFGPFLNALEKEMASEQPSQTTKNKTAPNDNNDEDSLIKEL